MRGSDKLDLALFLFLCAAIVEPFIWLQALERCFNHRYSKGVRYATYLIGDWLIAIVRYHVSIIFPNVEVMFTVLLILFVIVFAWKVYASVFFKVLLNVGLLFIGSLVSDIIIMGVLMLCDFSIDEISSSGLINASATLFSKAVFYVYTIIVFRKQQYTKYDTDEIVPILFSTILCELPSIVLYNKMSLLGNNEYLLLGFVVGQIMLLVIVTYFTVLLNRRKRQEEQLRTRLRDTEIEMKLNQNWEENVIEFRHYRHDIKTHLSVLKSLLDVEDYEKATQYLDDIAEGVSVTEDFCTMSNRNVAFILSQKKRAADKLGVSFFPEIMINDFIIRDKDICSILSNVLDNAIEAACQCDSGFVNIIIKPDPDNAGYFIICQNNYVHVELHRGKYLTTKKDKQQHGLGLDIIRRIVESYNGKCSFKHSKEHIFVMEAYIPGE